MLTKFLSPKIFLITIVTTGLNLALTDVNPVHAIILDDFESFNFSSPNSNFGTDYTFSTNLGTGAAGDYGVSTDPNLLHPAYSSFGDNTSGTGNMMVVNGATSADLDIWRETISVNPNTDYIFSAFGATAFSNSPAELNFAIDGSQIGSTFTLSSTTGIWEEFTATWNSGASTSVELSIINQNLAAGGNDFALDDISATPVPFEADSTMGILTLVGIIGISRLYKKVKSSKI